MNVVSLTPKSMEYLRKQGYYVEKTEHFNQWANKRMDFLGIGDVFATNGKELLIVQTTSKGHISDRLKKARKCEPLKLWIEAGGNFIITGWWKEKGRWKCKSVTIDGESVD